MATHFDIPIVNSMRPPQTTRIVDHFCGTFRRPFPLFFLLLSTLLVIFGLQIVQFKKNEIARHEDYERPLKLIRKITSELKLLLNNTALSVEDFTRDFLKNVSRWRSCLPDNAFYRADPCAQICNRPSNHIAIIIPAKNRDDHLGKLLETLIPLLNHQRLCYKIFVVDQYGDDPFNKAKIMNAGLLEALKLFDFKCVIFHDVDLIPQNLNIPYHCPVLPKHLSVSVDEYNYTNFYETLIGGVLSMPLKHFFKVNGYSNMYWGWGAEDDDMYYRLSAVHLPVTSPDPKVAIYNMIKHTKANNSPSFVRDTLLKLAVQRYRLDGLNSLSYRLLQTTHDNKYTKFLFDIGPCPTVTNFSQL